MAQRTRAKVGTNYTEDRYNRAFRDETNATIPDVQAPVAPVAPIMPVAPVVPVAPVAPNIQASKDNLYKKFDTLRNHKSKPTVDIGQHPSTILAQQEELEEWEKDHNILKEEAQTAHREAKALGIHDAKISWYGLGSRYLNHAEHGRIFISGGKKTKKRKKRGKRMKGKKMKGKGRKTKRKKSKTRKKKRKNFSKTKRKQ